MKYLEIIYLKILEIFIIDEITSTELNGFPADVIKIENWRSSFKVDKVRFRKKIFYFLNNFFFEQYKENDEGKDLEVNLFNFIKILIYKFLLFFR